MSSMTDRFFFALKCHSVTVFILYHMWNLVLSVRVSKAWNPIDPKTAEHAKIPVQVEIIN